MAFMTTQKIETDKLCFHCGSQKKSLLSCHIWDVKACVDCIKKFHRDKHATCEKTVLALSRGEEQKAELVYFTILLNRYDGAPTKIVCKKGQEVPTEPHWAGTYVFHSSGVILVKQTQIEINNLVLLGLRSLTGGNK